MASTQAIMGIDGTNEGQRRIRQLKINTRLVHSPDFTHFSITLQDIFVADQFATTEILAVRKYGEIEQKPSHFGRHRK